MELTQPITLGHWSMSPYHTRITGSLIWMGKCIIILCRQFGALAWDVERERERKGEREGGRERERERERGREEERERVETEREGEGGQHKVRSAFLYEQ